MTRNAGKGRATVRAARPGVAGVLSRGTSTTAGTKELFRARALFWIWFVMVILFVYNFPNHEAIPLKSVSFIPL